MVFLDLFWSHNSLETVIFEANCVLFWRSSDALRGSIWRSLRLLGTFWRALVLHGAHRGSYLALFNAPWHFLALFGVIWFSFLALVNDPWHFWHTLVICGRSLELHGTCQALRGAFSGSLELFGTFLAPFGPYGCSLALFSATWHYLAFFSLWSNRRKISPKSWDKSGHKRPLCAVASLDHAFYITAAGLYSDDDH